MPLKAVVAGQGNTNIGENDIPAHYTRGIFWNVSLIHRRHDLAVSHQRCVIRTEMHIVDVFAIAQALVAGINVRATLAAYNVFFYLHFRYPIYKVLYLDANEVQHLREAILVYRVA